MEELTVIDKRMSIGTEPKTLQDNSPAAMMMAALNNGADLGKLEKFMELQHKYDEAEARKAYHDAMSKFKATAPKIEKDRKVSFKTSKNEEVKYNHASLANVTDKINAGLGQHGLSAGWKINQSESGVTITCTITHRLGHSESTSLTAGADNTGSKNSIQAIASTISYLERYTLLAITGLATADMDDDGNSSVAEPIAEKQSAEINKIISDKNIDDVKFLKFMKVGSVDEIMAKNFRSAISALKVAKGKPKTAPCPEKDGKDVSVETCEECQSRKGCPSWGQ